MLLREFFCLPQKPALQQPLQVFARLYSHGADCRLVADAGPGVVFAGGQAADAEADLVIAFLQRILFVEERTAKVVQKVDGKRARLRAVAVQRSFLLLLIVQG